MQRVVLYWQVAQHCLPSNPTHGGTCSRSASLSLTCLDRSSLLSTCARATQRARALLKWVRRTPQHAQAGTGCAAPRLCQDNGDVQHSGCAVSSSTASPARGGACTAPHLRIPAKGCAAFMPHSNKLARGKSPSNCLPRCGRICNTRIHL